VRTDLPTVAVVRLARTKEQQVRIGILGTGTLAAGLGAGWSRAGHEVVVAGRSAGKARALADRLGTGVRAATPAEAVAGAGAVLLAVAWEGVEDILRLADPPAGESPVTVAMCGDDPDAAIPRVPTPVAG
jgi:pyrroline-5-carboxylate reductase